MSFFLVFYQTLLSQLGEKTETEKKAGDTEKTEEGEKKADEPSEKK